MVTSESTRERTLYPYIGRAFQEHGWNYRTEVGVEEREPDLIIEQKDMKIVSEVKIDSEAKLSEAISDAHYKAMKLETPNTIALLFPKDTREIHPSMLEEAYPKLKVTALILTECLSDRKIITLGDLAKEFTSQYQKWVKTQISTVNYDFVVDAVRDVIREIASYLRENINKESVFDIAMIVVGRFDIYKSMLEDFSETAEQEAKLYMADIASYVLANQLLFYHILSEKLGYEVLPEVNPLKPPRDLLDRLDTLLYPAREKYPHILGLNPLPLFREAEDQRIVRSVSRVISVLKMLRPQHIIGDLFGRLYQETIPPETRKNLGAFYTNPVAAKLLATLAIDKWDAKVLDPACGSGTLLVESYHRKASLAPADKKRDWLHKKFVEKDIHGIDVMTFATNMSSINLLSQRIDVPVKPNISPLDGIEMMVKRTHPEHDISGEYLHEWMGVTTTERLPTDFDLVIMNPPFTRRKRIPKNEREKLEKLLPEVKGKTGYWAYFVIAADRLLSRDGVLAVVIPEEFFVGSAAGSVRKLLLERNYRLRYIIRSAAQVAFSEGALYRDYLVVLSKKVKKTAPPLIVVILKKKLDEMQNKAEEIATELKDFNTSPRKRLSTEEFEASKVLDADELIARHLSNLKPLVGFNTIKANTLALGLLEKLDNMPTINELESSDLLEVRLYRPGQHRTKGVEEYAQKLFTSRYGARSPNVTFLFDKIRKGMIELKLKNAKVRVALKPDSLVHSLRTYSAVNHIDITGEEEFAIADVGALSKHILKLVGLVPHDKISRASQDIRTAYNDFASNILLTRRIQLTSPNAYWLAFYSDNSILGSQLPNVRVKDASFRKALALYLNSTITLLQIISFAAESRGSWVSLDHRRVWSNIHVPNVKGVTKEMKQEANNLLKNIGKTDVKSLYQRIKEHDDVQRSIDELSLEMIGLKAWKNQLNELYDAVFEELKAMHTILETSR